MYQEEGDQIYCPNSESYLRTRLCINMRTPRCLRMKCPQIFKDAEGETMKEALIYCIKLNQSLEARECLNRRSVSCYVCKFREYEVSSDQATVNPEILEILEKNSGYAYDSIEEDSEDLWKYAKNNPQLAGGFFTLWVIKTKNCSTLDWGKWLGLSLSIYPILDGRGSNHESELTGRGYFPDHKSNNVPLILPLGC